MNLENGPAVQALRFTRGKHLNSPPLLQAFVLPGGKKIIPTDSGPHILRHVSGNRIAMKQIGASFEIYSGDDGCNIEIQYVE